MQEYIENIHFVLQFIIFRFTSRSELNKCYYQFIAKNFETKAKSKIRTKT